MVEPHKHTRAHGLACCWLIPGFCRRTSEQFVLSGIIKHEQACSGTDHLHGNSFLLHQWKQSPNKSTAGQNVACGAYLISGMELEQISGLDLPAVWYDTRTGSEVKNQACWDSACDRNVAETCILTCIVSGLFWSTSTRKTLSKSSSNTLPYSDGISFTCPVECYKYYFWISHVWKGLRPSKSMEQ